MPLRPVVDALMSLRRSPVVVAAVVTSLVAVLVVSLAGVSIWQERNRQRERAAASTQNLARLLEGRVGDLLARVDILLHVATVRLKDATLPPSPALTKELDAMARAVPVVRGLYLVDAHNRLVGSWGAARPAPPPLSDLQALDWRRSDAVLQTGPVWKPSERVWVLLYSWPWHDAAGQLVGMVHAEVAVDAFDPVFKGIDLGRTGAATLRTARQLALVYRRPWPGGSQAEVGRSQVSDQLRRTLAQAPEQGEYVAVVPLDGVARINAYRRVHGQDLYLLVGLPETDVPKGWNRVDASVVGLALAAIGVAFLTVWALLLRSRQAVDAAQGRSEAIVNSSCDAIIATTPEGLVTGWNPAAAAMFGYAEAEMLGQPLLRLFPADRQAEEQSLLERLRQGEAIEHFETERLHRDGHRIAVSVALSPIVDREGRVLGTSRITRDITRQKALERQVREMAFLDPLTRLPNRRLVMERLLHIQQGCRRTQTHAAVLFVDLDRFKQLNDRHGHAMGDQVLIEVAVRLQAVVRENDTVGRLGGDEFVILCEGLGHSEDEAERAAQTVRDKVQRALDRPFTWDGACHEHGASVGIRVFGGGHEDLDALLHDADRDMYEDKARRRTAPAGSG